MAKKVLKKSFGIASLFMSALLCFLGGFAFLKDIKANATEWTQEEPTSLITADAGAIVSYDGGVKVSAEEAYEGQINHTFTGDTTLKFIFAQPHEGWFAGGFVFRVTDAVDQTKYFDVEYKVGDVWESSKYTRIGLTSAYVKYGDEVRTARQTGTTWYNAEVSKSVANNQAVICAPSLTINEYVTKVGLLKLGYDGDGHFAVTVNNSSNDNSRTIAAFDGTEEKGFKDQVSWGLPEMPFANGYTISFSSEFSSGYTEDKATDVLFKSIQNGDTTYTLTSYTNAEEITVGDRVGYDEVKVDDTIAIPTATNVENVKIVKPDGSTEALTMGGNYEVAQDGLHTVVYTTSAGSVAAYSFKTIPSLKATDFVYTEAAVSQTEEGLKVSSKTPYKAGLKGVFKGDTTLKFIFAQPHEGWFAGNFVFRITDASDETKYFDVEYKAVHAWTSNKYTEIGNTNACVKYGDEVRTAKQSGATWYNKEVTGAAAGNNSVLSSPSMTINALYSLAGILKLGYDADGHFAVTVSNETVEGTRTIAAFDGTEEKGFKDQESWGLPKMPFENGYTISFSSEFESKKTSDRATDVLFKSIENDAATYNFTTDSRIVKDEIINGFENLFECLGDYEEEVLAGKLFLGWKNTQTGELYAASDYVRKTERATYKALVISFDTLKGASVRIDTSENGQSGIRFTTVFDVAEYTQISSYIKSMGTLVMYTDILESKDFLPENFVEGQTIKTIENTKGTYAYKDEKTQTTYTAYSMAIVGIKDYAKEFSARAYITIKYTDGTEKTFYSDYNATDDARSIAQVAYLLKTTDQTAYGKMKPEQQAIIDAYADAYQE